MRGCVRNRADFLCTIFPPLSPVYVDPPVRRLWKTLPAPRLAGRPGGCSRNDQPGVQATDPQRLFPNGRGCGKLSTMPVGRTSQKMWTTCIQSAAGRAGRASDPSVHFLTKCRKSRRDWPVANFAVGFPHRLCSVLPARCGWVVDGSLRAAGGLACVGLVNICPGVQVALPILQAPWGREIQHVQLLGGTDPHLSLIHI